MLNFTTELHFIMRNYVGIVRTDSDLTKAHHLLIDKKRK